MLYVVVHTHFITGTSIMINSSWLNDADENNGGPLTELRGKLVNVKYFLPVAIGRVKDYCVITFGYNHYYLVLLLFFSLLIMGWARGTVCTVYCIISIFQWNYLVRFLFYLYMFRYWDLSTLYRYTKPALTICETKTPISMTGLISPPWISYHHNINQNSITFPPGDCQQTPSI